MVVYPGECSDIFGGTVVMCDIIDTRKDEVYVVWIRNPGMVCAQMPARGNIDVVNMYIETQKDIIVYHGSRGGIIWPIEPSSRIRCDFGQGFYMGTNVNQVKGIVLNDPLPFFYELKLPLSKIDKSKILVLQGLDWVYTVVACRQYKSTDPNATFWKSALGQNALDRLGKYDIVVGPIANDRMSPAIAAFENNGLTDEGLLACLTTVDYGCQYVAKTQAACDMIEKIEERKITEKEKSRIRVYADHQREYGAIVINDIAKKFVRKGRYLSELSQFTNIIRRGKENEKSHVADM